MSPVGLKFGPRQLKRVVCTHGDRLFYRVDKEEIGDSFRSLGVAHGAIICVHSSLSRIGYIVGGASTIIDSLMEAVGPNGCILMPSFPTDGSMLSYLESGSVFDVRLTPSRVGAVTETFRRRPGVMRSLHPLAPVAAWGKGAQFFLRDHEKSPTPFGARTPYGRLAERDDTFILMIETHIHSLLHHLQERVGFPNLHLPEVRDAALIDEDGRKRTIRTRVLVPRLPYFVAIPSACCSDPDWAILHDFALIFPSRRDKKLVSRGYRFTGYRRLFERREELQKLGFLTTGRLGKGEIGLLHVRNFLEYIEPELTGLIQRFMTYYDPRRTASINLPYF